MTKHVKTKPFSIRWCPRWDKLDALFYWNKSWEGAATEFGGGRIDFYSTRIQIGPIRIILGGLDWPE